MKILSLGVEIWIEKGLKNNKTIKENRFFGQKSVPSSLKRKNSYRHIHAHTHTHAHTGTHTFIFYIF